MSTSSRIISRFCSSASSPCVTCASPHIFPTQQLWTRQWGLQWPAWDLRWFCRLCLWKLMALSKCDPRWFLYELQEGQTACCSPEGCTLLWVKSLCSAGVIKRSEQGLHCSLVQGTFWVCCLLQAVTSSSLGHPCLLPERLWTSHGAGCCPSSGTMSGKHDLVSSLPTSCPWLPL